MRSLVLGLLVVMVGCGDDKPAVGVADADTAVNVETSPDATVEATVATETTPDATTADSAPDVAAETSADTAIAEAEIDAVGIDAVGIDAVEIDAVESDTAPDTTPDAEVVASTCASADDCALCAFGTKVESAADCYCVFCPTIPMLASECAANTASWNQFCNPWPGPGICPSASCIPTPKPVCEAGQCLPDPNGCFGDESCGACDFTRAPEKPEDCHCPGCPQPLAVDTCEVIQQAVSEVCADFDFDACPRPPCAFPPPIECGETWTCGYGERVPEDR